MQENGSVFFEDEYGQIYKTDWITDDFGQLDITTIQFQPFVWGEAADGFIEDGKLYRRGIITEERQLIKQENGNYTIMASGSRQTINFFQTSFLCEKGPIDNFLHRLNCYLSEENPIIITDGICWVDISELNTIPTEWADPDISSPSTDLSWIEI